MEKQATVLLQQCVKKNNNGIIDPYPTVLQGHQPEIDGAWTMHWRLFGDGITLKMKSWQLGGR